MPSARTRRKPRYGGSIRNCNITQLEYNEYQQTGMIRIKETPAEGFYFRQWAWGHHRCINFSEVLGAKESLQIPDKFEPPVSARILDTWHGTIAIDTCPTCYIITCMNYAQMREIVRDLDLYGYRTTSYGTKTITVYKPKKEFVAYKREDR